MCCGIVVIAAEPLTIPLLRRLAAIDVPGIRSSHSVPTPRGGGLPIVVGLLVAVALDPRGRGRRRSVRRSAFSACWASSMTCAG